MFAYQVGGSEKTVRNYWFANTDSNFVIAGRRVIDVEAVICIEDERVVASKDLCMLAGISEPGFPRSACLGGW